MNVEKLMKTLGRIDEELQTARSFAVKATDAVAQDDAPGAALAVLQMEIHISRADDLKHDARRAVATD